MAEIIAASTGFLPYASFLLTPSDGYLAHDAGAANAFAASAAFRPASCHIYDYRPDSDFRFRAIHGIRTTLLYRHYGTGRVWPAWFLHADCWPPWSRLLFLHISLFAILSRAFRRREYFLLQTALPFHFAIFGARPAIFIAHLTRPFSAPLHGRPIRRRTRRPCERALQPMLLDTSAGPCCMSSARRFILLRRYYFSTDDYSWPPSPSLNG